MIQFPIDGVPDSAWAQMASIVPSGESQLPMSEFDPQATSADSTPVGRFRPAVILPDGDRPVDLGSGTITAMIGSGGMANIYKIWNPQLEVHRAVKLMHPNLSEDSRKHFQTEMKIMAGLSHPNIVEIHSVGMWSELPYIEMEHINGITLDQIIKDRGALPVAVCTAIAIFVARALVYAHDKQYAIYGHTYNGIVHRDLKPSNIMVNVDGVVKLMDFGIARPVEASLHTTDGALMGTMQYIAPEQLDGKSADFTTDVYSFGAVVYEMITGVKAFPQVNFSKLMACKARNDYRPLKSYEIRIPASVRTVVSKCLQLDKSKRWQTANEVLAHLEKIHWGLTMDSPEEVMRKYVASEGTEKTVLRLRRRVGLIPKIAAAVAGTALVAMVTVALLPKHTAPPVSIAPQPVAVAPQPTEVAPAPAPATRSTKPRKVAAPTANVKPSPRPEPKLSTIDKLKTQYGTSDEVEIFVREVDARNYASAQEVYRMLSERQAGEVRTRVYHQRMLAARGAYVELRAAQAGQPNDDGELHLYAAVVAFRDGRTSPALDALDRSMRTPSQFMPAPDLRRECLYYTALCRTKQFAAAPSPQSNAQAMDAWYEVKNDLKQRPQHPYFTTAVAEMQRLAKARE